MKRLVFRVKNVSFPVGSEWVKLEGQITAESNQPELLEEMADEWRKKKGCKVQSDGDEIIVIVSDIEQLGLSKVKLFFMNIIQRILSRLRSLN